MAREINDNPYKGPLPFTSDDRLYNRASDVIRLANMTVSHRILLLHSPSGAGKTSLLQAENGLLAHLEREEKLTVVGPLRIGSSVQARRSRDGSNRYIEGLLGSIYDHLVRRGADPEQPTAITIRDYLYRHYTLPGLHNNTDDTNPGSFLNILLVIDQFEEVLKAEYSDVGAQQEFFRQLNDVFKEPLDEASPEPRVWALLALREEYLGALAPFKTMLTTHLAHTARLGLLSWHEALQSIIGPAADHQVAFSPQAADALLGDLCNIPVPQSDQTPEAYVEPVHLQVVCSRLWESRRDRSAPITKEEVAALGSVDTTLAAYYDEKISDVCNQLGMREWSIRQWVNQHLITKHNNRNIVRYGIDKESDFILEAFEKARLVRKEERQSGTWFELAHDRLVEPIRASNKEWLSEWETSYNELKKREKIIYQAQFWREQGEDRAYLLPGSEVDQAIKDFSRRRHALTHQLEEYCSDEAISSLFKTADAWLVESKKSQQRRRRRRTIILAILLAFGLVALGIAWLYVRQREATAHANRATLRANIETLRATIEKTRAESERLKAESERLKAERQTSRILAIHARNVSGDQPDLAMLLGVEALQVSNTVEARQSLLHALTLTPQPIAHLYQTEQGIFAINPENTLLAFVQKKHLTLRDLTTGDQYVYPDQMTATAQISFSADGKSIATLGVEPIKERILIEGSSATEQTVGTTVTFTLWPVARDNLQAPQTQVTSAITSIIDPASAVPGLILDGNSHQALFSTGVGAIYQIDLLNRRIMLIHAFNLYRDEFIPNEYITGIIITESKKFIARFLYSEFRLFDLMSSQVITSTLSGESGLFTVDPMNNNMFTANCMSFTTGSTLGGYIDDCVSSGVTKWNIVTGEKTSESNSELLPFSVDAGPVSENGRSRIRSKLSPFEITALVVSDNGKWLVAGGGEGQIVIWDTDSGALLHSFISRSGKITHIVFDEHREQVIAGFDDGILAIWRLASETFLANPLLTPDAFVYGAVLSPDEQTLMSIGCSTPHPDVQGICFQERITTWDLRPAQPISTSVLIDLNSVSIPQLDSQRAYIASNDTVHVLDIQTGAEVYEPLPSKDQITSLAVHTATRKLAVGHYDGSLIIWDLSATQPTSITLPSVPGNIWRLDFNTQGNLLAVGMNNSTALVYDLQTMTHPITLSGIDQISGVAINPQDQTVAGGGLGGMIGIWALDSPSEPRKILDQQGIGVRSLVFSSDGEQLLVTNRGGTVSLWHVPSSQLVATLSGRTRGTVLSAAFNADETMLISAGWNGHLYVWDIRPATLMAKACDIAGRNLTEEEWNLYVGAEMPYHQTCPTK